MYISKMLFSYYDKLNIHKLNIHLTYKYKNIQSISKFIYSVRAKSSVLKD